MDMIESIPNIGIPGTITISLYFLFIMIYYYRSLAIFSTLLVFIIFHFDIFHYSAIIKESLYFQKIDKVINSFLFYSLFSRVVENNNDAISINNIYSDIISSSLKQKDEYEENVFDEGANEQSKSKYEEDIEVDIYDKEENGDNNNLTHEDTYEI